MKRLALVAGLVLAMVAGRAMVARGYYLDTPHNESNGIFCYTCHSLPYWWDFTPSGPDDTMRNAVCLQCHGEGSTDPHRGPVKKPHASSTTSRDKGDWSTECTQCHDVHSQGQLDWAGVNDSELFLAEGLFDSSIASRTFDPADPQGGDYGATTIGIASVSGKAGWTDTATWGAKGGHMAAGRAVDQSRGLILVPNKANPTESFEIIGVTGAVLKVKGQMGSAPTGQTFGVIYGQSLRSSVMPNGGTTLADYRDVKFFKPEIIGAKAGGYIDESGAAAPQGLCQVCHDATAFWRDDGSSTEHNRTSACSGCHDILKGLAGGTAHRVFIGDRLGNGCTGCHAAQVAAPEGGHPGGCPTCHVDPKPTITTAPLANEGGIPVATALSNGGYRFAPRLTDAAGKVVSDPGFVMVDCSECHELKLAGHGGHGGSFGWNSNCVDCHGPAGREVVREVHNNLCTLCHDPARVAAGDYTVRIAGATANGIDGSAVGATTLARCTDCHNTNTPGVIHHDSKHGYAAAGDCGFCHATAGHQGNHTNLVAWYGNCVTCHGANVGSSSGAPVDPTDPRKHDGCTTCHALTTSLKSLAQVNGDLVVAMPDGGAGSNNGGGSCADCHGEYFPSHGHADHLARVAGNLACDSCHSGTAGTLTTVPTSLSDPKLHDDCSICHQATGALRSAYGKAPGMVPPGGTCTSCHGSYFPSHKINHFTRVAGTSNCTGCHTATAGLPGDMPVNPDDPKVHDGCATCHDNQSNNLLKAPYGKASAMPAGGGDCNACHGAYFVNHGNANHAAKVVMNSNCSGCHEGTQGTATGMPVDPLNNMIHDDCTTCHDATTGALVGLAADHSGGGDCLTCHLSGHDTNLDHTHRVTSGLITDCTACHAVAGAAAIDTLHGSCQTCHGYRGSKLDPATVVAVIAAGRGSGGSNQNCEACHTINLHHTTREAVNNNCTTTCHPAVDHRATIVNTAPCTECHIDTAGTATGAPLSFTDTMLHKSCRSCHAFAADQRGILVNFTNNKGVNGSGSLPNGGTLAGQDGGGVCTVCHTLATPGTFHHSNAHAKVGECEYCHSSPVFSDWGADTPGDNGGNNPYPTQLACLKCHVRFAGGTMTVSKFEHGKTNYSTDFARSTQDTHTISGMTANTINTYEICMGCHYTGSPKLPATAQVKLFHAKPTWGPPVHGSPERGQCGTGSGVFAPGRSTSSLGQFLIFRESFWPQINPTSDPSDPWCVQHNYYMNDYPPPGHNPYVSFALIEVPFVPQNGNPGARSVVAVPVLPSVPRQTVVSATADNIKVSSATWNGTNLYATATTTNSSGCSTLTARYNGHDQPFTGSITCVAAFPPEVVYTGLVPTMDVKTSNPSGLDVSGSRITESLNPELDITPPLASTVVATPSTVDYVPAGFSLSTEFIDAESPVTSCAYTTDGMTWTSGVVSGSRPLYTCTANPSSLSGDLTLNMRATSTGGLRMANAIARSVDATSPVDGVLTVTPGFWQNSLAWTTATDSLGGLRNSNTYDVRFLTGTTAPTCSTGTSLYLGSSMAYTHTGIIGETTYSYRICAYDNLNNVSAGATGSGSPPIALPSLSSPTATIITETTATLGVNITSDGGTSIIEHGTLWGTSPTTTDNRLSEGSGTTGPLSQARTGLPAGTKIYYRGYATNSVGTVYSPEGSFYTKPATQASEVSFTEVGPNSMTVHWVRGDGDGVIVLMRLGAPVAQDPSYGYYTIYSADSVFRSGREIGQSPHPNNAFVIYNGTGTSVAVTGLSSGYVYYVSVYEYKGTVDTIGYDQGTNYKDNAALGSQTAIIPMTPSLAAPTATSIVGTTATLGANITAGVNISARGTVWGTSMNPTGNLLEAGGTATGAFSHERTGFPAGTKIYYRGYAINSEGTTGYSPDGTFYTEPSTGASGVGFQRVGLTGMPVTWTRGNGDGVIVLMKQGSAVSSGPSDGNFTGYAANPAFGSGSLIGSGNYVVYQGSGTSVSVTGLTAGATYYVAVYEYSGSADSAGVDRGTNYISTAATGNWMPGSLPILALPTATSLGNSQANLGATVTDDGGADISERGTVWGTSANPAINALPEGGTTITSFSQERTGLPAGTKIYYRGYATNGLGTGYSPGGSFYTEPDMAEVQSFTAVTQTSMTVNWTRGNGDEVIVLMRTELPVNAAPVDGVYNTYYANSIFGWGKNLGSNNFVVYRGSGTSVTVNYLSPGFKYYVAVYEYKGRVDTVGVDQGANYAGAIIQSCSTLNIPPTITSPTASVISDTEASMGATVTSTGTGLLERGTVWDVTDNPTANVGAEGGTSTGGFNQWRSGLPAGTKIYYRGYAENTDGIVYSSTGSFYTQPALQASGVSVAGISGDTTTVNWTRGNGDGVIVVMRDVTAVDSDPVDGTYSGYTANPVFGSGTEIGSGNFVVYQGSGTSVTVTGLNELNTYSVEVFEYQGTEDASGDNRGTSYKVGPATAMSPLSRVVSPGNPFQTMLGIPGGTFPPVVEIQSGNYSVPPGSDRLLLVVLHYEVLDPMASIPIYADYGMEHLLEVQRIDTGYERVWVGYMLESGIALSQNQPLYVWIEGNVGTAVFTAGTFTNVNQFQPINDSRQSGSDSYQSSFEFAGPPFQGPPLMVINGGRAVYFGTYDNATTTQEPPPDFTELYDRHTGGGTMFTFSGADKAVTADGMANGFITLNQPEPHGVVAVSLRP